MKKAIKKQLEKITKDLPNIPVIQNGRKATVKVMEVREKFTTSEKHLYVNKLNFFEQAFRAGKTAEQAIKMWYDKSNSVKKLLGESTLADEVISELETKNQSNN